MKVSLIFVAESSDQCCDAMRALAALDAADADYEVLLALGRNPSEQRNKAAQLAQGDFLLFLDNDSLVTPAILRHYAQAVRERPDAEILGGPAAYVAGASPLSRALCAFFSSRFGSGPFLSRYSAQGALRPATERDLILCNLLVKRALFQGAGGFHPELYPGEENEFLNRIERSTRAYYQPRALCHRAPPSSLAGFAGKLLRYGAGRARHMLLPARRRSALFLLPPLLALMVPFAVAPGLPLLVYFSLALLFSWEPAIGGRRPALLIALPPLFFCGHFCYGAGLLWGVLRHPFLRSRPRSPVAVTRVKPLGPERPVRKPAPAPGAEPWGATVAHLSRFH